MNQIHRLHVEPQLAGHRARDVEEIVDQLRLGLGVALDGLDRALPLVVADLAGDQHPRPAVDRGQRRPQLVRHRHQEFVLHPVRQLLAAQQLGPFLDVGPQLELAAAAAQGDRDGAGEDQPPHRPFEDGDVAQRSQHGERAFD